MRRTLVWVVVAAGCAALEARAGQGRVAVAVPVHGRIDAFLVEAVDERLREAERPRRPALILFDLHTTNGPAGLAIRVADAIHTLRERRIETVALVREPGSAPTTLLALACDQLFVAEGARLAAVDPAAFDPPATADETRQLLEAVGRYCARRPRLTALYEGFVDPATEVYGVVLEGREEQTAFHAAAEFKRLLASERERVVRSERVAKQGARVELAAEAAKRLGVSAGTVASVGAAATRLQVTGRDLRVLKAAGKPAEGGKTAAGDAEGEEEKPARKPVGKGDTVVVVPLSGAVGEGWLHSLKRRLKQMEGLDPALVVFEIDTYGGGLKPALEIGNILFGLSGPRTVAYVNTKAISAGALVSIACDDIVMQKGSSIGASQIVGPQGEPVQSEKLDSVLRARCRTFCEGKYPAALAMAMITLKIEVVEAKTADGGADYLTRKEVDQLTPEERERYTSMKTVVHSDELLTMTDTEAKERGFSKATVRGRGELLKLYGLSDKKVVELGWNWSESFVRTLDAIGPVLLALGVLGIIIELKTPGFGVFGMAGIALVAIFFFGKYTAGLAEVWEIALFVVGVALLAAEVFVTPGFGVLGVLGIVAMVSSMLLSLQPFVVPISPIEWKMFHGNLATIGGVILGVFAGAIVIARYLHRAPYVGRLVLPPAPASTSPTSVTASVSPAPTAEQEETRAAALVGRRGRAVSMLRPAGRAEFDGEPLDVVTEGDFIHPGEPIEVCAVRGNRVVVRRAP